MSRTYKKTVQLGRKSTRRLPSKYCAVGPGGFSCPCCFPAPGKRKEEVRSAKRKESIAAFKIEEEQNED